MFPRRTFTATMLLLLAFLPGQAGGAAPWLPLARGVRQEQKFRDQPLHRYGVELTPGQFARVRVFQRGADLSIVLSAPSGREILEFGNPSDRNGVQDVPVIADTAGVYTFEIRPAAESELVAGGYDIELLELRDVTPEDRDRTATESMMARGCLLILKARPEDLSQAASLYEQALAAWRRLGDRRGEASALYGLGVVYYIGNQAAKAAAAFEQTRELWHEIGDVREESMALNQLGRTYRLLGDSARALGFFHEALPLARAGGDPDLEAALLHNLAKLQVSLGDLPSAVDAFLQAREIYRRRGDPAGEAFISLALGDVENQQGHPSEALNSFEKALALTRQAGNLNLEAESLNRLGSLYQHLGQPQRALEYLLPALDRYGEARNFASQGLVLSNLGSLLDELGEPAESERMLRKALPLLRDPRDEAEARLLLSRAVQEHGESDEALRLAEEALATHRRMEHPVGEAAALRALGSLHLDRGEARQAQEELLQALKRFEAADHLPGQAAVLRGLGEASSDLGDGAAADLYFQQALALAQKLGDTADETRTLESMARSQRARGKLSAARETLTQALARLESLRSEIAGDNFRASHFAAQRAVYELYVDVLEQLRRQPAGGDGSQAFEAAERSRARGMLDFLSQSRVDLHEGDPDLLKEEERLRLEMNAKSALRVERLRKPDRTQEVEALDRELSSLEAQYQIVEARLDAKSPGYAKLKQPEVRLADVQQTLDADTVLLEYFLAEPRSYLWLVTPDSLASFELPGRAAVEKLAQRVHEELGRLAPQTGVEARQDLEELSRILLGPIAGRLHGKRLAIVPDGALLYVPFSALPVNAPDGNGKVPLIVEHEVVQLPSAAVVREIRRSRKGRSRPTAALAVLADPVFEKTDPRLQIAAAGAPSKADATRGAGAESMPPLTTGDLWSDFLGLPRQGGNGTSFARLAWTRREAEAIAGEGTGRDVLLALDFRANRDLVTEGALDRYQIVHLATHGVLDTQHPALSGLVFSQVNEQGKLQDGFLRLHDIYHLHLNADLVVLSGCETALGKTLRGEGIMGLTRGFFHAGASQVLASLWPVRDRATAELMQRFYHGMFRDGLPASAALRQAQISMWKERQWRDPYFWAGFVLQGDWQAARL